MLKAGVSLALLAYLFSRVDVARLWQLARIGLDSLARRRRSRSIYLMIGVSAWRWGVLLDAQGAARSRCAG